MVPTPQGVDMSIILILIGFFGGVLICCGVAWMHDEKTRKRKQRETAMQCVQDMPSSLRLTALLRMMDAELLDLEQVIEVMVQTETKQTRVS